jgi:histidine triad (HIT) family protein
VVDGEHVVWGDEHILRIDDRQVAIVMNAKWWRGNEGSVIVVPVAHYENIYELPVELGGLMQRAAHDVAVAMKRAFGCAGVSTRQHNEPAGDQEVWHYHLHVIPRYEDDHLYTAEFRVAAPEIAAEYARRLADLL